MDLAFRQELADVVRASVTFLRTEARIVMERLRRVDGADPDQHAAMPVVEWVVHSEITRSRPLCRLCAFAHCSIDVFFDAADDHRVAIGDPVHRAGTRFGELN